VPHRPINGSSGGGEDESAPQSVTFSEAMLRQFDRRYEQRFSDLNKANEQRFSDLGKANEVALAAQKEALKTASETTDKALGTAGVAVEKALIIERQSTKDKFDTLNETVKRIESQTSLLIPRGEVTEKIDGVSERVKKVEDASLTNGSRALGMREMGGWIAAGLTLICAIVGVILMAALKK
jgi:hypothetical protein